MVVEKGMQQPKGFEGIPSGSGGGSGIQIPRAVTSSTIQKFKIAIAAPKPDGTFGRSLFPQFHGIWGVRTRHSVLNISRVLTYRAETQSTSDVRYSLREVWGGGANAVYVRGYSSNQSQWSLLDD